MRTTDFSRMARLDSDDTSQRLMAVLVGGGRLDNDAKRVAPFRAGLLRMSRGVNTMATNGLKNFGMHADRAWEQQFIVLQRG